MKVVKWFGFLKFVDKSEKNKSINYADDVTRPLGRRGCWRGAVRGNLGAFFHRFFLLYRKILRVLGPFLLLVSVSQSVCLSGPSPVLLLFGNVGSLTLTLAGTYRTVRTGTAVAEGTYERVNTDGGSIPPAAYFFLHCPRYRYGGLCV